MNRAEKEAYLREYSTLKAQGKPFFPYAVAKDSVMAVIVMLAIILMSLALGAELGPKADPTTTTYVPRPEWYFFFLFELLRVIKPPALVAAGDDRHPDDRDDPAVPAAVLRPQPRAPARAPPDRHAGGHLHDRRDGLPDLHGRQRPARRRRSSMPTPARIKAMGPQALAVLRGGQDRRPQSGCLACHKIGDNGNDGPGPPLTHIGARLPKQAIARTLINPTAPMPSFKDLPTKTSSTPSSSSSRSCSERSRGRRLPGVRHAPREPGAGDVRPHRRRLRPHELGHDRRAAPPLAPPRGRPGRRRPGRAGARRRDGHGRPRDRARRARRSRRRGRRLGLLRARCSSGRATKDPRDPLGVGQRAGAPVPGRRFDAATVGFGARNFADLGRGLAEMARVVRPGGRVVVLEITTPTAPAAVDVLLACGSTASCRRWAASPATPTPTSTCPARSSASRAPEGLAAVMEQAGPADGSAGSSPPAASSPSTSARWRDRRRVGDDGPRGRRRPPAAPAGAGRGAAARARRRDRPAGRAVGGRDDRRRRQAPAPAARPPRRRRRAAPTPSVLVRAAAAVELVHAATLVHDDVLDAAAAAPGPADGVGDGGPGCGDRHRRPALRARVRRLLADGGGRRAGPRAVARLVRARRGRADAARRRLERRRAARALPAPLRAEDRPAVRGGLRAGRARAAAPGPAPRAVRARDRARLPAARRRARRQRARPSARASTAAPTCSTAP